MIETRDQIDFKKRARRRLVGAVVLALIFVIMLPMVMDKTPPPNPEQPVLVQVPEQPAFKISKSEIDSDKYIVIPPDHMPEIPPDSIDQLPSSQPPAQPDKNTSEQVASNKANVIPHKVDEPPTKTEETSPSAKKTETAKPITQEKDTSPTKTEKTTVKTSKADSDKPKDKPKDKPASSVGSQGKPSPDSERALAILAGKTPNNEKTAVAQPTSTAKPITFHIQIAAYTNPNNAQQALDKITKLGIPAYDEKVNANNGQIIRVRAGPFATRQAAEQALNKIKQAGLTPSGITQR